MPTVRNVAFLILCVSFGFASSTRLNAHICEGGYYQHCFDTESAALQAAWSCDDICYECFNVGSGDCSPIPPECERHTTAVGDGGANTYYEQSLSCWGWEKQCDCGQHEV